MSQLKCNPLHYAIATLTSATTFNQKKLVAKLLWLPFLGLLLHFFGVAVDQKSCSGPRMRWSRKDRDGPLPHPCRLRLADTGATGSLLIHGGIPSSCGGVAVGGTDVSSFAARSLNYIGVPENHVTLKLCPRLVRSKQVCLRFLRSSPSI